MLANEEQLYAKIDRFRYGMEKLKPSVALAQMPMMHAAWLPR